MLQQIRRNDFHGIVSALMTSWAQDRGKPRWGEKTPEHCMCWQPIREGFPNAQVIHIVRDGRDVAISWRTTRFGPKHIYAQAKLWVSYVRQIESIGATMTADSYYRLRYEDLITDFEPTMHRLCDFLSEKFESDSMARFYLNDMEYNSDSLNRLNLKQPLLMSNTQKWKKQMNPQQLRLFEAVAGDLLEQMGYSRAVSGAEIGRLAAMRYKYIEHPVLRAANAWRNWRGVIELYQYGMLRLKLRIWAAKRGHG
jgi:hypothetical protein